MKEAIQYSILILIALICNSTLMAQKINKDSEEITITAPSDTITSSDNLTHQFAILNGASLRDSGLRSPYALSLQYLRTNSNQYKRVSAFARINFFKLVDYEEGNVFVAPLLFGMQYKLSLGKIQPFISIGGGVTYLAQSEGGDFSVLPFDLGIGVDAPINYKFSIRADLNFSTLFTPSVGVVYNLRKVK